MPEIARIITSRAQQLVSKLPPGIQLHHFDRDPVVSGIVTFSVPGWTAEEIVNQLDGIAELSVVPATSTPLDSAISKVPNLVRASVSYTTTVGDIEVFTSYLHKLIESRVL